MNPKQKLFVAEYLANGMNATNAYISAGYSKNGAAESACALLRNPKVAAAIASKTEKRLAKLEVTADRVVEELAKMGFANMLDYISVDPTGRLAEMDYAKITRDQAAAIQEITMDTAGGSGDGERKLVLRTRFKLGDKRGSLELLGKHLKMFTDKVEHSGSIATTLSDEELNARLAALTSAEN
jgi:phage terminase small subunit